MTKADKTWIDNTPYDELLRVWRKSNDANPLFTGDTGKYFRKVLKEKLPK